LEKIAKKRRWFQRDKWNEMRICAANTLKVMAEEGTIQIEGVN
jgi:hypothetical protein